MNNISSKSSQPRANQINTHKPVESVETAGSLAMAGKSIFSTNVYDVFTSSNPFAVDYSQYSTGYTESSSSSGFLSNFSSAVSTLGSSDCSGSASVSSGCGGGASSCSGGSSSFIC